MQCVRYFETYPERIQFNDQDLLNVVLCKDKVFVPLKWNMQDGFYRYGIDKRVPTGRLSVKNCCILSFCIIPTRNPGIMTVCIR